MSVKKFRFVSPGVFINEIDRSQLERLPARMGPVIVGRSERGPGFRPTIVHSFAEFVELFGNPIPGGEVDDVWRNGNYNGPTYGAYAAQAYLKNNNPVTFVRLLGAHHDQRDTETTAIGNHPSAGWRTTNLTSDLGGAYGLFVMPSGSVGGIAKAVSAIDTDTVQGDASDSSFTITVPTSAGGESPEGAVTILLDEDKTTAGSGLAGAANQISIGCSGRTDAEIADRIVAAINGDSHVHVVYATSGLGQSGVDGITASITDGETKKITFTMDLGKGTTGNAAAVFASVGGSATNVVKVTDFTGGVDDAQAAATGTLAAVWYLDNGYMWLSGTLRGTEVNAESTIVSGSSVLLGNSANLTWKAIIRDSSDNTVVETAFSFDPASDNFIRRAFNTNPQLVNTNIYSQGTTNYWLGQTFEKSVQETLANNTTSNSCWGVMLQLASGSSEYSSHLKEHIPSETGWIVSQDTSADAAGFDMLNEQRTSRLFKFVSLDAGSEWNQNNLKISIEDIRPAKSTKTWPSFTVTVRAIGDSDKNLQVLEKFSNCNLNAGSPNYIARKIGDKQVSYDKTNKLLKVGGNYDNNSRYIRVETNEGVYSKDLLPFGCYGPPRYKGFTFTSGSDSGAGNLALDPKGPATHLGNTFILAGASMETSATASRDDADLAANTSLVGVELLAGEIWTGQEFLHGETAQATITGTMEYPALALRSKATNGGIIDQSKAYWGVDLARFDSDGNDVRYDPCVVDYLKTLPDQTTSDAMDFHLTADNAECQFLFTLDDLVEGSDNIVVYTSGSRQDSSTATEVNKSITAKSGSSFLLTASTMGHDKFTTVLYGGFDGLDIREKEPFNDDRGLLAGATEKDSYGFYSITKAIEIIKDPERVECNLMAIPGVTNADLTTRLVRVAEERADTMAVIDIRNDFTPAGENTNTDMANQGNVDEAVRGMKDRSIDSSYGAAYYPWVQIRDTRTNQVLWAPPSVVALGTMAYSDAVRDVWFAPAGFNRGGLTATNAGGVPVVGVNQQLTSKQRDKLYEVNVNPIASFPAEGIVIFGQKTLQLTPSALDRINVRRLLIFLKKEISRIASTTLFEPNLEVTWATFRAKADVLLSSVKAQLGLADYKLVLDETTTTPELVDRNIMYAKVFLKPARAIEFIALDFIITRSGASFED